MTAYDVFLPAPKKAPPRDAGQISVISGKRHSWDDIACGCPEGGPSPATRSAPGARHRSTAGREGEARPTQKKPPLRRGGGAYAECLGQRGMGSALRQQVAAVARVDLGNRTKGQCATSGNALAKVSPSPRHSSRHQHIATSPNERAKRARAPARRAGVDGSATALWTATS